MRILFALVALSLAACEPASVEDEIEGEKGTPAPVATPLTPKSALTPVYIPPRETPRYIPPAKPPEYIPPRETPRYIPDPDD